MHRPTSSFSLSSSQHHLVATSAQQSSSASLSFARLTCSLLTLFSALHRHIKCEQLMIRMDSVGQHWLCASFSSSSFNNNNEQQQQQQHLDQFCRATTIDTTQSVVLLRRPRLLAPFTASNDTRVVYLLLQDEQSLNLQTKASVVAAAAAASPAAAAAPSSWEEMINVAPFHLGLPNSVALLRQLFSVYSSLLQHCPRHHVPHVAPHATAAATVRPHQQPCLFASFSVESSELWGCEGWSLRHCSRIFGANAVAFRSDHNSNSRNTQQKAMMTMPLFLEVSAARATRVWVAIEPSGVASPPQLSLHDFADYCFPDPFSLSAPQAVCVLTAIAAWFFQHDRSTTAAPPHTNSVAHWISDFASRFMFSQPAAANEATASATANPADLQQRRRPRSSSSKAEMSQQQPQKESISQTQQQQLSPQQQKSQQQTMHPQKKTTSSKNKSKNKPVEQELRASQVVDLLFCVQHLTRKRFKRRQQQQQQHHLENEDRINFAVPCTDATGAELAALLQSMDHSRRHPQVEQRPEVGTVTVLFARDGELVPSSSDEARQLIRAVRWSSSTPCPFVRLAEEDDDDKAAAAVEADGAASAKVADSTAARRICHSEPVLGMGQPQLVVGPASRNAAIPVGVRNVTVLVDSSSLPHQHQNRTTNNVQSSAARLFGFAQGPHNHHHHGEQATDGAMISRAARLLEGGLRDLAAKNTAIFLPDITASLTVNSSQATQQQQQFSGNNTQQTQTQTQSSATSSSQIPAAAAMTTTSSSSSSSSSSADAKRISAFKKRATVAALTPAMILAVQNIVARSTSDEFKRRMCRVVGLLPAQVQSKKNENDVGMVPNIALPLPSEGEIRSSLELFLTSSSQQKHANEKQKTEETW